MAMAFDSKIDILKNRILNLKKSSDSEQSEIKLHLEQLVEEATKTGLNRKKRLGNPAVVGLAGFGLTTLLFQFYNFGWMKPGPVLWMGLMYGGLSQFIAGLLEFAAANDFGFSAFTTYGAFWIALVATIVANDYTKYEARDPELAMFLAAFAIYTFIMLLGATRHNTAITVVFLLLFSGLVILSLFHFFPHLHGLKIFGAIVLTICAFSALYVLAHLILQDSFKRNILPVGPPIHMWFSKSRSSVEISTSGQQQPRGVIIQQNQQNAETLDLMLHGQSIKA